MKGALELEREEKVQIHVSTDIVYTARNFGYSIRIKRLEIWFDHMQADLKSSESAATALHQKIMHLEQDLVTRKESIKSLTDDLINSNKKYEELSRLLDETQQEVCVYYGAQVFTCYCVNITL